MSNILESGFVQADSRNLPSVDMGMIFDFISNDDRFNAPEIRGAKACVSARESYGDSAIGYVCLKRVGAVCIMKGRICPEHKVRQKSYSVILYINEEEKIIENIQCLDCAAAQGGCKHSFGFLMWAHRRSEDPSPTEVQCYWKKSILSGVGTEKKFILASEMSKIKEIQNLPDNSTFLTDVVSELQKQQLEVQISKYTVDLDSKKVYKLSIHQCLFLYSKEPKKSADGFILFVKNIIHNSLYKIAEEVTQEQSNSTIWHELRYARVTASKLYGAAMCKTVDGSLVKQIIGASKLYDNLSMKRGRQLENEIFQQLIAQGLKIQKCGFFILKSNPIFGASPDGIGQDFIVEIKCPCSEKTMENYIKHGKITKKFEAQMLLQMLATDKKKGLFCVAHWKFEENKQIYKLWVDFREDLMNYYIEKASVFWKKNIYSVLMN